MEVLEIQVLEIDLYWKYATFYSISSTLYLKYQTSTHVLEVLPNSDNKL